MQLKSLQKMLVQKQKQCMVWKRLQYISNELVQVENKLLDELLAQVLSLMLYMTQLQFHTMVVERKKFVNYNIFKFLI